MPCASWKALSTFCRTPPSSSTGERKVVAWNRAIEEMTGMGKSDILGKGDHAYAIPFYGEARSLLIDLVLSRDEEYEKKYEYVRTKGVTLYAEALVPMLNGGKRALPLDHRFAPLRRGRQSHRSHRIDPGHHGLQDA